MNRRLIARSIIISAVGAAVPLRRSDAKSPSDSPFGRTAAEMAAGVEPADAGYPSGDIRRYGADPAGTHDSSAALSKALLCNSSIFIATGTYLFEQQSPFSLRSGQTVHGDGPASDCLFSYGAGNNFEASGAAGAAVRRLQIRVSGSATSVYIGAVAFLHGCSDCIAEECDISGVSGCGVYIENGSKCVVRNNFFHDFKAGNHDQADVFIRGVSATGKGCAYCVIDGNQCFGGGWHGIACLTGSSAGPVYNTYCTISNNRIGQHSCYGILQYSANGVMDHFNQIVGNYIENIQGKELENSSGAGIYAVATGGDVIANNIVRNCCISTTTESLAPAGIGISGASSMLTPVSVTGNIVSGMTRFCGILAVSCTGSVLIQGNSVNQPVENKTGHAIKVNGSSKVSVQGNMIVSPSPASAILVQAESDNVSNISICDNSVQHAGAGLTFYSTHGALFKNTSISGNNFTSSSSNACFSLANILTGTIANNCLTNGGSTTCVAHACTGSMFAGNTLSGASAFAFESHGDCTGSFVDKSNHMSSEGGARAGQSAIANGATGMHVEQLGTALPRLGSAAPGDVIYNSSGSMPFAWRCIAAGTPGAWSELASS